MKNKKLLFSLFILGLAILLFIVVRIFSGSEDAWLCQNGQWVKHGAPSTLMPTTPCPGQIPPPIESEIIVTSPQPNAIISSPLLLEGQAKGTWFFEASFPVKLYDANGNLLAQMPVQATEDWMTEDFVHFKGEMTFDQGLATTGKLIFQNDNPSGLPQNRKSFEVPVQFPPATEAMTVKVYFNNDKLDPQVSCNKVFVVDRQVPKTEAVARAAISELLKGPTAVERTQGYYTSINPGVEIQSLTIENGVAKIDFNEQIQNQVGGSCRVAAIRSEITETLKQFSTVKSVIISVNGDSETSLQP
ncbi:MAG: GerMN domain-containing protein [Patescibacteria group bacterium]|nr:GerMN domain-containing protein [Patescibacteria group bacterium]MDD5121462.1 GerMN domain-containing protein [Patescibacteria group bacterium]MDD5222026.1 GerMN domain-containing protein [Patescibacteria group bacterium]MDD5396376.1 GerMN domain-containing protein [Patescibacteria group bacterium]